ncbi:hypothetical protein [Nonomuraea basaltis]|uniref:hypothetical protein n=1 Tax=Nonomuraea basaltis TaxID=2495887 RepID=UPI00110C4152|nr:hypothetical protein [Nonomuraea basaltis]TMR94920.1 hypothetical protein EJK15_31380 [Nonomuraea basaltis]
MTQRQLVTEVARDGYLWSRRQSAGLVAEKRQAPAGIARWGSTTPAKQPQEAQHADLTGNIIEAGTESYRLAQTRAQADAAAVASKAAG